MPKYRTPSNSSRQRADQAVKDRQYGEGLVLGNRYNATTFTPVATNRIRPNITAKAGYSTGIESWRVHGQQRRFRLPILRF